MLTMQKVIRINESQLNEMIKKAINENTEGISPLFVDHWRSKFEKSVVNLLKIGFKSDELIEKIKIIENTNSEQI